MARCSKALQEAEEACSQDLRLYLRAQEAEAEQSMTGPAERLAQDFKGFSVAFEFTKRSRIRRSASRRTCKKLGKRLLKGIEERRKSLLSLVTGALKSAGSVLGA